MLTKRPKLAAALIGILNGALILYCCLWIAGVPELRHASDWRGPLLAFLAAIGVTAYTIISQIEAVEKAY